MYTNYTIMASAKVPFPTAPSGVAGLILLWRRRDLITPRAVACFLYRQGIYENDARDVLFYKRVRPKFFSSEPASVTVTSLQPACEESRLTIPR
jgi:hypothetical protein